MTESATDYRDYWYHSGDGLRLYARDYPGPAASTLLPVLCMHGLTRNSADFADIASHLAGSRRVISVDVRGRGRSDYDPSFANYQVETYVNDMFALLDGLGLQEVVAMGTSMGGLMAMVMANLQPQRFAAVIMNDIGPELDPEGLDRIKRYVGRSRTIRSWDDAVEQTREINGQAFPNFTDDQWLTFTRRLYREQDGVPVLAHDLAIGEAMREQESNAVPPDLWPLFENMAQLPILVVRGAISDLLSTDCVARMHQLSPTLKAVEVPERGHAPMLDEPAAVSAIDDFLGEVDAPAEELDAG